MQLDAVSPEVLRNLQYGILEAAPWYLYYGEGEYKTEPLPERRYPDGGATAMLVRELEFRADGVRYEACRKELEEPHFFFRKQFCGRANVEAMIKQLGMSITKREGVLKKHPGDEQLALEVARMKKGAELLQAGYISRA